VIEHRRRGLLVAAALGVLLAFVVASATGTAAVTRAKKPTPRPPRIAPVFAHPYRGEGVWHPTGPPFKGGPPMLVATYRPDTAAPSVYAYVAWFDHTRTSVGYYPGRSEPPNAAVRGPMEVPTGQRWRLLAAFNSGFTYAYSGNGSSIGGRENEPLKPGLATLVQYRSGAINILDWHGGAVASSRFAWARQSCPPIVWNGKANTALNDGSTWGQAYPGPSPYVWRTAVGIDRGGNLIFVVADSQTVETLARLTIHVGAVRAMQLDINAFWHTLITYRHKHGLHPTLVEPQPNHTAERYLTPDDRDFFAVYRRMPGPVTDPFK